MSEHAWSVLPPTLKHAIVGPGLESAGAAVRPPPRPAGLSIRRRCSPRPRGTWTGRAQTADHDISDIDHGPNVSGGSDVTTNAKTTSTTRSWRPERTLGNQLLIALQR